MPAHGSQEGGRPAKGRASAMEETTAERMSCRSQSSHSIRRLAAGAVHERAASPAAAVLELLAMALFGAGDRWRHDVIGGGAGHFRRHRIDGKTSIEFTP